MKCWLEAVYGFNLILLHHIIMMSYRYRAFAVIKGKDHVKITVEQEMSKVVSNLFTRFQELCGTQ